MLAESAKPQSNHKEVSGEHKMRKFLFKKQNKIKGNVITYKERLWENSRLKKVGGT